MHSEMAFHSAGPVHRILVLCYGNIYRSPLAAYLLNTQSQVSELEIRSAGFFDKQGRQCTEDYLKLLVPRGYDLSAHRSRKINPQDIEWADLIIIMDRKNWDLLYEMDAAVLSKTVWIGGFSDHGSVEVIDPYDRDEAETRSVIEQLELCAQTILAKIESTRSP
ncbi:MAG: hypothetical protein ABW095_13925 [Candidatus Thiodiazotropha sp.]